MAALIAPPIFGILHGNGLLGGLAAWFAFTMPSALILFAFALGATAFTGPFAEGILHGAKLLLLTVWKLAPWIVVVLLAATGAILRLI